MTEAELFLLRCDVGHVINSSTCDPKTIVGIKCGQCMHAAIIIQSPTCYYNYYFSYNLPIAPYEIIEHFTVKILINQDIIYVINNLLLIMN